jgi:murein L,D-transpeptidase YcbB/YkuD
VPPTILRDDMLPARRKDPEYFKVRNIRVLDNSMNIIDESKVDWSRYPGQPFPYILRQDPGAENALGRIKFMFPNAHAVYLHDTPSRGLFEREQRAFSSGCIRIEAPYRLAESLLADPVNWSQAQIVAAVDSRQTQTVRLKNPVPVLLMYWTADTNQDGNIRFKPDIYQRDQAVLEALNAPFRLHGRHLNTAQREK